MIIRKVKVTEYEYQAPINYVAGATEPDIQFQLTDYEIPSGATGRVYVGRSDGTFEYTVATISGNTVTVAPTSSMFSVKGAGAIQVTLYVGNEVVKNFAVPVYVHADLADDSAEAGSDVTGVFRAAEEEALADFQEQAEEIVQQVIESIPADYTELTEEVDELNERLDDVTEFTVDDVIASFVIGTISSTYGTYDSSNLSRIATDSYLPIEKLWFNIPNAYDYNLFFYKGYVESSLSNYISTTGWINGKSILGEDIVIPASATIFKFIVRWHDTPNSPITPTDFIGYNVVKKAMKSIETATPAITFICRDGMVRNDIPPNSIFAIRATAKNQYDKIRFSVNKTTDGKYVCVHDTTINNLAVNTDGTPITATINTADCTLAELNTYDWGLKFGQKYAGLKVPVLAHCVKYATMYNLTIALDIKFSLNVTDEDVDAISLLLAKYGQLETIFFGIPITTMQKFYAKSKKYSYLFASTYEQANGQAGSLRLIHSAYNKIYLAFRPMGSKPTEEYINLASVNDFDLMFSPIEGINGIKTLGFDSGSSLLECHYIENIKDTIRQYVDTL